MREYAELMLTHGPKAKNEEEILLYSKIREVLDKGLGGSKTKGNPFTSRGPFDSHHEVLQRTIRELCHTNTRIRDKFRFHSISTRIRSIEVRGDQHSTDHHEAVHNAIEKVDVRIVFFRIHISSII